ncbi:putative ATPase [Leucobacter exalbidus]|uniref:ATPase n=1 Tax=Leucobacter exalbidus TaxID=662960 RepID=A0A940PQP7_9MICO|nr:AAA family ATPase [Leucobacter exalbidus]MBP1324988.1 putative ATPase [Leucobacter exalbidus]
MSSAAFSRLPVRRVEAHRLAPMARHEWPATVPAVAQLLAEGLDLAALTVFVGENGAGKSTLIEAIAGAFGLNTEGGTHNAMHHTQRTESVLADHLQLVRGTGSSKQGVFLRAETMHGHFAYLDDIAQPGRHNFQSHGESFIEFFTSRAHLQGLWIFDEAESALSFNGQLALLSQITELLAAGSQVLLSTHSPILAALPQAALYELGDWGLRPATFDELAMTQNWRLFLDAPERYLRHLG